MPKWINECLTKWSKEQMTKWLMDKMINKMTKGGFTLARFAGDFALSLHVF